MISLTWKRLRSNTLTLTGCAIILILLALAITRPWLMPDDPMQQNIMNRLKPPSSEHWFGTDELGRDVFSRVYMGLNVSLGIGFLSAIISITFGTIIGLIAGYFGRWVDAFFMRLVDIMLCFPTLYLILMILAVLDKPNIYILVLILSATSWPGLARMVRGEVLSVRERDFMLAARGLGLSTPRLLFVHLLPNVITPVIVAITFAVGNTILAESGLSFLGLGVQPPNPSWGNILTSGKDFIHMAWWLSLFPGLAILITVLAFNLLGEGLRDALDPRLKQ